MISQPDTLGFSVFGSRTGPPLIRVRDMATESKSQPIPPKGTRQNEKTKPANKQFPSVGKSPTVVLAMTQKYFNFRRAGAGTRDEVGLKEMAT